MVVYASVGMATGFARTGIDCLLREADAAMYAMKGGRTLLLPASRSGRTVPVEVAGGR